MYRINDGNGFVSRTFETLTEARRELGYLEDYAQRGGDCFCAKIERYEAGSADDPGDWFRVRDERRHHTHDDGIEQ